MQWGQQHSHWRPHKKSDDNYGQEKIIRMCSRPSYTNSCWIFRKLESMHVCVTGRKLSLTTKTTCKHPRVGARKLAPSQQSFSCLARTYRAWAMQASTLALKIQISNRCFEKVATMRVQMFEFECCRRQNSIFAPGTSLGAKIHAWMIRLLDTVQMLNVAHRIQRDTRVCEPVFLWLHTHEKELVGLEIHIGSWIRILRHQFLASLLSFTLPSVRTS